MKTIKLDYLPPFRFEELLDFFRMRAISGVEVVDNTSYSRCARVIIPNGEEVCGYFRVENDERENALVLSMSESLLSAIKIVERRVRKLFDLDCDPATVHAALAPLEHSRKNTMELGVRLPGAFDAFETCCRAVLGQQISVSAANKLAARVAATFGTPIETSISGCELAWPTPKEVLSIPNIESAFGKLGVIKNRTRAIVEIARLIESGELTFENCACSYKHASENANVREGKNADSQMSAEVAQNGQDTEEQMKTLLQIRGIGPWTANYILMRVQSFSDAFLETDVGVVHALPNMTAKERLKLVEPCKPWRSYAVISLWNSLGREEDSQKSKDTSKKPKI